jgi:hypothetical protein
MAGLPARPSPTPAASFFQELGKLGTTRTIAVVLSIVIVLIAIFCITGFIFRQRLSRDASTGGRHYSAASGPERLPSTYTDSKI